MTNEERAEYAARQWKRENRPRYNAEKIADLRQRVKDLKQELSKLQKELRETDRSSS